MPFSEILSVGLFDLMVRSDGSGSLAFDEADADALPSADSHTIRLELPQEELIAIRDFLNKQIPSS